MNAQDFPGNFQCLLYTNHWTGIYLCHSLQVSMAKIHHFFDLPEHYHAEDPGGNRLRCYLGGLDGFEVTGFVTDDVTEAWIDFEHRGHHFSLNNQHGSWWTFVEDPGCPDEILLAVARLLRDFARRGA